MKGFEFYQKRKNALRISSEISGKNQRGHDAGHRQILQGIPMERHGLLDGTDGLCLLIESVAVQVLI